MANESFISLCDAANSLPKRNGKSVHRLTVRNWIVNGLRKTRLAAIKIGGVWFTTQEWMDEFFRATTQVAICDSRRHPSIKRESHLRARRELQRRLGLDERGKKIGR
jgi:hypothetical protein